MYEIHDDHNPTPAIRAPLRRTSPSIPTDRGENNVFQLLGGIFGRPFFAASPPPTLSSA